MNGEQEALGQEPAVDEATDDDFESGFAGKETSATETPAAAPAAESPAQETPTTPAPAPAEPVKFAQIPEADLQALRQQVEQGTQMTTQLRGQLDKVFGKMGALEQVISKRQTETPAGEAISVSADDFSELKSEYPELAELTLKGLNKVLGKFKGQGGADPEALDARIGERLQTFKQSSEKDAQEQMLNAVLPGWREEVKTPDFSAWIGKQPAQTQALAASDDPVQAARLLRQYDRYLTLKAIPAPATAPTPASVQGRTTTRQRQLAAAVPVKGDGLSQPSAVAEEDPFEAGFRTGRS